MYGPIRLAYVAYIGYSYGYFSLVPMNIVKIYFANIKCVLGSMEQNYIISSIYIKNYMATKNDLMVYYQLLVCLGLWVS